MINSIFCCITQVSTGVVGIFSCRLETKETRELTLETHQKQHTFPKPTQVQRRMKDTTRDIFNAQEWTD